MFTNQSQANIFSRSPSLKTFRFFRSIKTKLSRDLAESSAWSRRGRAADNGYAVAEDDEVDRFALSELGMLARR